MAFPEQGAVVVPGERSPSNRGRPHVDLWTGVRAALARAGVDDERVEGNLGCTRCQAERFHSYRRDGPRIGQQLAFIGLRADPTPR